MASTTQYELKVDLPVEGRSKSTLKLSPTGDLELVEGTAKLQTQIIRAIVNDQAGNQNWLNTKTSNVRAIRTMVVNLLRQYRLKQLNYVNRNDPNLTGYSVWRRAAGTNEEYARISGKGIKYSFVDTDVYNGTTYDYGITRVFNTSFESPFVDTFSLTPQAQAATSSTAQGTYSVALVQNSQVTFYVDYTKTFKATEILDKIIDVFVVQETALKGGTDPRKYIIDVKLQDYAGTQTTISPIGSQTP